MRISNQTPADSANNVQTSLTRADSASGLPAPNTPPSTPASVSAQEYDLVPSFELLRLNAALHQVPAVRPEALAETIRQLITGDLQSPDALSQTAAAILGE